jgi:hypothetical protein
LVTLIYWVASSILGAVFVYRSSKSTFMASAAGLCLMFNGLALTDEAGHPQQLVLLLYMVASCLSLPSPTGRIRLRFFLLGCVGAALVFTKVNVGVFYIAGLAYALFCLLPPGRIRSFGIALMLGYAASIPWLLMHASFNLGFVGYCLVATAAGVVTFAGGALVRSRDRLRFGTTMVAAAGLIAGTLIIVVATSLQGMSLYSLVWGTILNPMGLPKLFTLPLRVSNHVLLAILIVTAAIVGLMFSGRRLSQSKWFYVAQCAAGIGSILLLVRYERIEWVASVLPLTLVPRLQWGRDDSLLFSRFFITAMAVTQFLEPFPAAGSQVEIAAAPMILWAFLCISDGVVGLNATWRRRPFHIVGKGLPLDALIGGTILVLFAVVSIRRSEYRRLPPASAGLEGSSWLHLPTEQAAQFGSIARNVGSNCRILFTMPGMGSFNMWSGVPTPNGWNHNDWMGGIPLDRQAEILRIMKSNTQACAILNRGFVRFWDKDDAAVAALPLARYVMTDMPKVAQFGDYEILVHPSRSSPWVRMP